jgi:hypothetical protein
MIDSELTAFLEQGVGIHIAARNAQLEPSGARAIAVKVSEDRLHLDVFVPEIAAGRILPNLERNGQAAVVFGRPTDDRSCQVKGVFVGSRAATAAEEPFVRAQWAGFRDKLEQIGIPRATSMNWIVWPAIAIRLKATALFEQTPGPQAGAPLS